ncbi:Kinesin heavy chain [Durusdinium trenchii]|uniref:Kinesin-like protein n=1 Tax=Durusdinium trenchii TaxID=1381693 RepID=A0ABP0RV45_9DINO
MATRITCLALTVAALLAAVCCFSWVLPESEAFVSGPQRLRSQGETAVQAERRERAATDLDEQYGKPPPTETPQFATSNVVYKEKMKDLLRPNIEALRVKELPQRGLFVDGLSREYVTCAADVQAVIAAGLRSRVVGKTRCNLHSSRSHVIFVLHVEQSLPQGEEKLGKLTLVDLAGSEKVSKSECVGETLEEAKKINWSLSALGKVIDALAEQRPHVPYRDSQLTRVLQEALGGNCRTTLLVAASGAQQHADETLSSLRFATRAKSVRNVAKVNYTYSPEQLLLLVAKLQKQLASAHEHIVELGGFPRPAEESPTHAEMWERTHRSSSARLSKRSVSSPKFAISDEASPTAKFAKDLKSREAEEDDLEAEDDRLLYNEATLTPLLAAARRAIANFEETLLAQEKSLTEVRLLRASREDGVAVPRPSGPSESGEEQDLMSERFRALQHAVNARSYKWRLQLEEFRSESLAMESQMRSTFAQDLERALAEARWKLSELQDTEAISPRAEALSGESKRSRAGSSMQVGGGTRLFLACETVFGIGVCVWSEYDGVGRCCFFVGKPGHPSLAHNEAPVDSEFVTTGGFSQELLETQRKLRGLTQQRLGFREAEEEVDYASPRIHSKDLQLSALRHEIRIKDALLGCLQDEERRVLEVNDSELEMLLEKALSPLAAILTRARTTHRAAQDVERQVSSLSAR